MMICFDYGVDEREYKLINKTFLDSNAINMYLITM